MFCVGCVRSCGDSAAPTFCQTQDLKENLEQLPSRSQKVRKDPNIHQLLFISPSIDEVRECRKFHSSASSFNILDGYLSNFHDILRAVLGWIYIFSSQKKNLAVEGFPRVIFIIHFHKKKRPYLVSGKDERAVW